MFRYITLLFFLITVSCGQQRGGTGSGFGGLNFEDNCPGRVVVESSIRGFLPNDQTSYFGKFASGVSGAYNLIEARGNTARVGFCPDQLIRSSRDVSIVDVQINSAENDGYCPGKGRLNGKIIYDIIDSYGYSTRYGMQFPIWIAPLQPCQ